MTKKAFIVGFCPQTRVVVDIPDDFDPEHMDSPEMEKINKTASESVVAKFATPKKYGRREGFEQTQYPEYYSLEMITSVGYHKK